MGVGVRSAAAVAGLLSRAGLSRLNHLAARALSRQRIYAEWNGLTFESSVNNLGVIRDLQDGNYEPYATAFFATKAHGVVVDVGANIGIYTLLAARTADHVYAFEPDPRNIADLEANVRRNGFTNVTVIPHAAAAIAETRTWHTRRPAAHSGLFADYEDYLGRAKVETVRLDDIVERADVVKIDAEGAEVEVLAGGQRLFATKPELFIEYAPHALEPAGRSGEELLAVLDSLYESVQLISERGFGLVPVGDVRVGNLYCR